MCRRSRSIALVAKLGASLASDGTDCIVRRARSVTQNFCLSGARWATLPAVRRGVNGAPDGVVRRSLPEQVATLLHEQIANGTYPGGSKLPHQRDLAASFGVSIAVAREALALLAAGGLVRARSGQGTFVTDQPEAALRFPAWVAAPMGAEELTEAIEARDVIEHATAIRAAHRRSEADVERLRELVGQMADAGDDAARVHRGRPRAAPRDRGRGPQPPAGRRARGAAPRAARHGRDRRAHARSRRTGCRRSSRRTQDLVEAVATQDLRGAGAAMDAHARPAARRSPRTAGSWSRSA